MPSPIATLYSEELKATMRGRFAWLGAGVLLLILGGMATLSTQGGWLQGYGTIAYGLVPLAFIPIAAGMMASPRTTRFVECVFTAPVSRRDWFAAKFLVLFTLAVAYYVALIPSMLVYVAHVGMPTLLHKYLLWAPGILITSITVGSLIGILFIGRSVTAPIGAAMGVLLAYVVFIPLQEVMATTGNGASRTGHMTLASPAALLKNALGFVLGGRFIPSQTRMTWISLAVIIFGSLLLAIWVFLRAQGVETWEATRGQRWIIIGVVLVIALFPTIFAETNYDTVPPPQDNAPQIRFSSRSGVTAALVLPGARFPRRCCSLNLNWDSAIHTNQDTPRDLLILLPIETTKSITNLQATVEGGDGLDVAATPAALDQSAPPIESFTYRGDSGPEMPDGHRITTGSIVRIPITLNPHNPWDLDNRYPLHFAGTFDVSGDPQPHKFEQRAGIEAQIPGSMAQMGFAAALLPLCCFGAAFARWRRTR